MYKLLSDTSIVFKNPFPQAGGDGSNVLSNAMTLLFGLLGAVSVLVLVYAGIRLSAARGNPDAIGKLRSTIIYAAIGLVVAISATAIISLVIERV